MLRLFASIVALWLGSAFSANAALILTKSGITREVGNPEGVAFEVAQFDFSFPTYNYLVPTFAGGPLPSTPLPPRYTYRIVIETSEPAALTLVSPFYPNYQNINYIFENGKYLPTGGDENLFNQAYFDCSEPGEGICAPGGYIQGNKAIFTFGDGIAPPGPYIFGSGQPQNGDLAQLLIGFHGSVSVSALLSPEFSGATFTAQVFQFPAVPEPMTWALFIIGFGGIGATLRRRRKSFGAV